METIIQMQQSKKQEEISPINLLILHSFFLPAGFATKSSFKKQETKQSRTYFTPVSKN